MARDYKRRSNSGAKKKSADKPWVWLVAGFGLGLVAAAGLYLNMRQPESGTPVPNVVNQRQSASDLEEHIGAELRQAPTDGRGKAKADSSTSTAAKEQASLPAQGDPAYDFYDMLPDFEVVVPDSNSPDAALIKPGTAPSNRQPVKPVKPGNYILQAGSFRKFTDADRRKAELAFKGIESNIQQVVLGNDQTWYRVYVGPTKNLATLEKNRSTLRRDNIDVLILKVSQ